MEVAPSRQMISYATSFRSVSSTRVSTLNLSSSHLKVHGTSLLFYACWFGGHVLPGCACTFYLMLHAPLERLSITYFSRLSFFMASFLNLQHSQTSCTVLHLQLLTKEKLFKIEFCILHLIQLYPMNLAFYLHHSLLNHYSEKNQ